MQNSNEDFKSDYPNHIKVNLPNKYSTAKKNIFSSKVSLPIFDNKLPYLILLMKRQSSIKTIKTYQGLKNKIAWRIFGSDGSQNRKSKYTTPVKYNFKVRMWVK